MVSALVPPLSIEALADRCPKLRSARAPNLCVGLESAMTVVSGVGLGWAVPYSISHGYG